jgi:sigma-B regulation protein RsbU (phosphoserine phosphatase)
VAKTQVLLNIPDAYADPRFNPGFDKETKFRTRSILCAPMVARNGRLMGVLQALNKAGGGAFSAEDEELLLAFASHAAIAIDRAQLVEAFVDKQRIEESLRLAHDIQMGMLPRSFPEKPGLRTFAKLLPARSVGGDLYDVVDFGDRIFFVVGDVSGKGIPAALFMAVTKTLFRASAETERSPDAVIARVNRELSRDNERSMFVTAFVGCLDVESGELRFSNAGHNPPYRVTGGGAISEVLGAHGMAMGILEEFPYTTESLKLDAGDSLFLFTDGVVEALNDRQDQFGTQRLTAFLGASATQAPDQVVNGILTELTAFVGAVPQFDDIAVLSLRFSDPLA